VSSPDPLILSDVAGAIHRHSDNPRHPSPLWISEAFGTDPIPDYHREAWVRKSAHIRVVTPVSSRESRCNRTT
jgi:hypothetical protein